MFLFLFFLQCDQFNVPLTAKLILANKQFAALKVYYLSHLFRKLNHFYACIQNVLCFQFNPIISLFNYELNIYRRPKSVEFTFYLKKPEQAEDATMTQH